jgi:hypothetical protein
MTPWAQIVMIALMFANLMLSLSKHGEEQAPHNFWVSLLSAMITVALLAWGGFWAPLFGG